MIADASCMSPSPPIPPRRGRRNKLREAFPWDQAPRFLVSDHDHAFDGVATAAMGLTEVRTAPRSPWQNAYVERFIGSVRRECLDHVIILNAAGLNRVLHAYVA